MYSPLTPQTTSSSTSTVDPRASPRTTTAPSTPLESPSSPSEDPRSWTFGQTTDPRAGRRPFRARARARRPVPVAQVLLRPRSLLVYEGDAYRLRHGIREASEDRVGPRRAPTEPSSTSRPGMSSSAERRVFRWCSCVKATTANESIDRSLSSSRARARSLTLARSWALGLAGATRRQSPPLSSSRRTIALRSRSSASRLDRATAASRDAICARRLRVHPSLSASAAAWRSAASRGESSGFRSKLRGTFAAEPAFLLRLHRLGEEFSLGRVERGRRVPAGDIPVNVPGVDRDDTGAGSRPGGRRRCGTERRQRRAKWRRATRYPRGPERAFVWDGSTASARPREGRVEREGRGGVRGHHHARRATGPDGTRPRRRARRTARRGGRGAGRLRRRARGRARDVADARRRARDARRDAWTSRATTRKFPGDARRGTRARDRAARRHRPTRPR